MTRLKQKYHMLHTWLDENYLLHIRIECPYDTIDRPCHMLNCPECLESTTDRCIIKHGAEVLNKCWAEEWVNATGGDGIVMSPSVLEKLRVSVPVEISFDIRLKVDTSIYKGKTEDRERYSRSSNVQYRPAPISEQ